MSIGRRGLPRRVSRLCYIEVVRARRGSPRPELIFQFVFQHAGGRPPMAVLLASRGARERPTSFLSSSSQPRNNRPLSYVGTRDAGAP